MTAKPDSSAAGKGKGKKGTCSSYKGIVVFNAIIPTEQIVTKTDEGLLVKISLGGNRKRPAEEPKLFTPDVV